MSCNILRSSTNKLQIALIPEHNLFCVAYAKHCVDDVSNRGEVP